MPSDFEDFDRDDSDLGTSLEDVPAQSLDEVLDEIHDEDPMDDAFDDGDEAPDDVRAAGAILEEDDDGEPAAIEPPMSERLAKPIGQLLSAIALQGLSAHAKKRPLSALDDDKVVAIYRRISSLLDSQPDAKEAEAWRADIRVVEAAAAARSINLLALPEGDPPAAKQTPVVVDGPLAGETPLRSGTTSPIDYGEIVLLAVDVIAPDPAQARDEGADDELADLIKANGFYRSKPIEVRLNTEPAAAAGADRRRFMIVDGERRYRAAIKAGLTEVPAMLVEAHDEGERLLRQVNSNEGKRLKPMEEARTYKRIMAAKGWNIQQLAEHLGKSKSTISDRLALADVPTPFLPLFEKGELTAAAAPILRPLQGLSEEVVGEMIAYAREGADWDRATSDGKPVPLKVVEAELAEAARENDALFQLAKGSYVAKHYQGPSVAIGKDHFATDTKEVDRLLQAERQELAAAAKVAGSKPTAPAPKPAPSPYQLAERKKAKAAKAKGLLRRAQLVALSPKLPTDLDAKWAGFLVRHLIRETTNDTRRETCKLLNLEPPKQTQYSGYNFDKALLNHAESLKGPELVRFALQILIAADLAVSTYGSSDAKRLTEAAALAKFDLKKVKIDGDATAKNPSFAPDAKGPARKKGAPAFMQPFVISAQLEAVVGKGPMVRTEVTKKLWQYIKRNGLQDKKERRLINADEKLKVVFGGKKQVSMFEMTKLINKHTKG